jgi:excinuclease ABC subunit B
VTTLTKRSSEDLTAYYDDLGVRVRYLHSEIDVMERSAILRDLRLGQFDVLVGINLLREGLDLPEVALVAVLDADKEGFLRSTTSLIQTCGRAARNADGRVLMYADRVTASMRSCIDEVERRRVLQGAYNRENGITPKTIIKPVRESIESLYEMDYAEVGGLERDGAGEVREEESAGWSRERLRAEMEKIRDDMLRAANELEFERAASLRDELQHLEQLELER